MKIWGEELNTAWLVPPELMVSGGERVEGAPGASGALLWGSPLGQVSHSPISDHELLLLWFWCTRGYEQAAVSAALSQKLCMGLSSSSFVRPPSLEMPA